MILTIKDVHGASLKPYQFTDARTLRVVIGANVKNAINVVKVKLKRKLSKNQLKFNNSYQKMN
jgi:hypothetical protein